MLGEQTKNVPFDSVIVRDDVMPRTGISPCISLAGCHSRCEVQTFHRWTRLELRTCFLTWSLSCSDHTTHDANRPQMPREPAGINLLQDGHIRFRKPRFEIASCTP